MDYVSLPVAQRNDREQSLLIRHMNTRTDDDAMMPSLGSRLKRSGDIIRQSVIAFGGRRRVFYASVTQFLHQAIAPTRARMG